MEVYKGVFSLSHCLAPKIYVLCGIQQVLTKPHAKIDFSILRCFFPLVVEGKSKYRKHNYYPIYVSIIFLSDVMSAFTDKTH